MTSADDDEAEEAAMTAGATKNAPATEWIAIVMVVAAEDINKSSVIIRLSVFSPSWSTRCVPHPLYPGAGAVLRGERVWPQTTDLYQLR